MSLKSTTEPITVNQLIQSLQALQKLGYGNAKILVPTDEVMNDIRVLYLSATNINKELVNAINEISYHEKFDNLQKDYIILG